MSDEEDNILDKKSLQGYVTDLEEKLRETKEVLEKQQQINLRIRNNYESLDQKYDKLYSLLTEDQKRSLVNIKY